MICLTTYEAHNTTCIYQREEVRVAISPSSITELPWMADSSTQTQFSTFDFRLGIQAWKQHGQSLSPLSRAWMEPRRLLALFFSTFDSLQSNRVPPPLCLLGSSLNIQPGINCIFQAQIVVYCKSARLASMSTLGSRASDRRTTTKF